MIDLTLTKETRAVTDGRIYTFDTNIRPFVGAPRDVLIKAQKFVEKGNTMGARIATLADFLPHLERLPNKGGYITLTEMHAIQKGKKPKLAIVQGPGVFAHPSRLEKAVRKANATHASPLSDREARKIVNGKLPQGDVPVFDYTEFVDADKAGELPQNYITLLDLNELSEQSGRGMNTKNFALTRAGDVLAGGREKYAIYFNNRYLPSEDHQAVHRLHYSDSFRNSRQEGRLVVLAGDRGVSDTGLSHNLMRLACLYEKGSIAEPEEIKAMITREEATRKKVQSA
jgi:hypothetical protein